MGVRGLFSYIERNCPEALEDVDLQRLGAEYYRKYRKRPVLVLDANNFLAPIYGNLEFALGGQWIQYLEKLKTFLSAFRKAGFELEILFDGVVERKKLDTWIRRRMKERELVTEIFKYIRVSRRHPPHNLFHIPPSLSSFTRLAFKSLGASVHNSSIELDRECYLYCKKNRSCYGVISRDTDLMIYDIPAVFLLTYNSDRMDRMQLFRRDVLCRHLGLPPWLLPLFACLVGCDTVSRDMLFAFHRSMRNPLIRSVANFIRSLGLRDLSRDSMDWVASQVNDSLGDGFLYECVQEYACDIPEQAQGNQRSRTSATPGHPATHASSDCDIPPTVLQKIKSYHSDLKITDVILQAITIRQFNSNMALDDDADDSMPSSGLVYRPVRQFMYGLLTPRRSSTSGAASDRQSRFLAVEEFCCYAGSSLNDPDIVQGLALEMDPPQPTIEDLWAEDTEDVKTLRMKVFFSCLSSSQLLESGILDALPHHLILLSCILHYLLLLRAPPDTLRSCDVDAVIAQAICVQGHSPDSLRNTIVPKVDPRAVHLSTLLVRGFKTGCDLNSACCLPFKMDELLPWRSFDGKLFHIKYLAAAQDGQLPAQLLDNRVSALETFNKMRHFAVMGTRLQE